MTSPAMTGRGCVSSGSAAPRKYVAGLGWVVSPLPPAPPVFTVPPPPSQPPPSQARLQKSMLQETRLGPALGLRLFHLQTWPASLPPSSQWGGNRGRKRRSFCTTRSWEGNPTGIRMDFLVRGNGTGRFCKGITDLFDTRLCLCVFLCDRLSVQSQRFYSTSRCVVAALVKPLKH